jgi:hypothetical protein
VEIPIFTLKIGQTESIIRHYQILTSCTSYGMQLKSKVRNYGSARPASEVTKISLNYGHQLPMRLIMKQTVCTHYLMCTACNYRLMLMALQPFCWQLGRFFGFLILYTIGRTLLCGGSAHRKVCTYTQDDTQNKHTHRHPYLTWDSNPRSQHSGVRRQFMPETARPLFPAVTADTF